MAFDPASEDDVVLAAELVLGLLEGAARDEALRRQREDPAFAREVEAWSRRFEDMFAAWPSATPPESLDRRVLAIAGTGAGNDNEVTRWKWATAIAGTIAACLALVLLVPRSPPAPAPTPAPVEVPAPTLAVAFAVDNGAKVLPAAVDLEGGQVRLPAGLDVPADRVAQLWLIEGKGAPQPIGLFHRTDNGLAATVKVERPIPAGAILAISIEPPGGSPTNLPTGPVVATGELKPI